MRELLQWLAIGGAVLYPWLGFPIGLPNLVEAEKAYREAEEI